MEFGINQRSILDELQHFKVCSGALVQDVMHDVLHSNYHKLKQEGNKGFNIKFVF